MKTTQRFLLISLSLLLTGTVFLFVGKTSVLGYGESGPGPSSKIAPSCDAEKPAAPWLYYSEAISNNQVKLVWDQNALATSWTIAYGLSAGHYIWGWDRFGDGTWRSVVINELPQGTYYFVVRANHDCMPGPFSNEVKVTVGNAQVPSGAGQALGITTPAFGSTDTTTGQQPTLTKPTTVSPTPSKVTPGAGTGFQQTQPTQKPKPSFWQSVLDFFKNLFGG